MPLENLGWPEAVVVAVILALSAWSAVWKGIALWMAARRDQLVWYVILLVLNTVGILEMVYIFRVTPKQTDLVSERPASC
jgi:methionyl-tRNA synthetase